METRAILQAVRGATSKAQQACDMAEKNSKKIRNLELKISDCTLLQVPPAAPPAEEGSRMSGGFENISNIMRQPFSFLSPRNYLQSSEIAAVADSPRFQRHGRGKGVLSNTRSLNRVVLRKPRAETANRDNSSDSEDVSTSNQHTFTT